MSSREIQPFKARVRKALHIAGAISMILIVIHLIQYFFAPFRLRDVALVPRSITSITGILSSVWFHSSFEHLFSNLLSLFAGIFIIFLFYPRIAWQVVLFVYLTTELTVWLLARPAFHIGASGVVYGLLSFIFWSGIFRRSLKAIVLALAVMVLYSGMLIGIFPIEESVSWESHLFGLLSGVYAAFLFKDFREPDEDDDHNQHLSSLDHDDTPKRPFFPPGTLDDPYQ